MKVACVEMRGTLGGTCLNVGCIPSKALLHASEMYEQARTEFGKLGIKVDPQLDLPTMHGQKVESVGALTKGIEFLFRKNKAVWIKGRGRIAGPGRVAVTAEDGSETELEAKNIVIATGSEPTPLPGVEFVENRIVDSTGALALPEVPKKLVVVGAGIIGLELGSVWRRLGAEVQVIEYLDRITPGVDGEVAKTFQRSLTKQGMSFRLGTKVTGGRHLGRAGEADGGALRGRRGRAGRGRRGPGGHRPAALHRGLGLESVGIETQRGGMIPTTTTAPRRRRLGDRRRHRRPHAGAQGRGRGGRLHRADRGQGRPCELRRDPGVIYTSPEVAWVGATRRSSRPRASPTRAASSPSPPTAAPR
jgi:dihydrolipoamide dehydrogenase